MKRFYKQVSVKEQQIGFSLFLDDKIVKTPLQNELIIPSLSLAEAIAQEWHHIEGDILPALLPLTGFINSVIDKIQPNRMQINQTLATYALHDMVCYAPESIQTELAAFYQEHIFPIVQDFNHQYQAGLHTTIGTMPITQPDSVLQFALTHLDSLSDRHCAAFYQMLTLSGSFVLAVNVLNKKMPADKAWRLSCYEEDYNIQKWGMDTLQAQKRENDTKLWNQALDFLQYC